MLSPLSQKLPHFSRALLFIGFLLSYPGLAFAQTNSDADTFVDTEDNCTQTFNPLQTDTDLDGYGNACDADFNNDGMVNISDYSILALCFSKTSGEASDSVDDCGIADMNGDAAINISDFSLFYPRFNKPVGPSGLDCAWSDLNGDGIWESDQGICASFADSDLDGLPDNQDNCIHAANTAQTDTDLDGYGNACDADLNNDGLVGFPDFGLFGACYTYHSGESSGSVADCAIADLDDNDTVGFSDFGIFAKYYTHPPGPSGLPCAWTRWDGTETSCQKSLDPVGQPVAACTAPEGSQCYFLDPLIGSDSNPGTESLPLKSFAALSHYFDSSCKPSNSIDLNPGDQIILKNGTYSSYVTPKCITDQVSERFVGYLDVDDEANDRSKPNVIKAYPGHHPRILMDYQSKGLHMRGGHWHIQGIEIGEVDVKGITLYVSTALVEDVYVHDVVGEAQYNLAGIDLTRGEEIEIRNSTFRNNYERGTSGVRATNSSHIYLVSADEPGEGPPLSKVLIHGNDFIQEPPYNENLAFGGGCVKLKHPQVVTEHNGKPIEFKVYDNVFYNCYKYGVWMSGPNMEIFQNVFVHGYGNGGAGAYVKAGGSSSNYSKNQSVHHNTFVSAQNRITEADNESLPNFENFHFDHNVVYDDASNYSMDRGTFDIERYLSDAGFDKAAREIHFDENCYYQGFDGNLQFNFGASNGGSYGTLGGQYTFSQWKNLGRNFGHPDGYDPNSLNTMPEFVNFDDGDLRIVPNTACHGKGAPDNTLNRAQKILTEDTRWLTDYFD